MFSGAVKLGDLNDYIAPSQACVVALQGGKIAPGQDDASTRPADADAGAESGGLVLQRRRPPRSNANPRGGGFQQTYTEPARDGSGEPKAGAVRVTLHDCLACAGCVTSAETVLLQQQSATELLQRLRGEREGDASTAVVVSISPQSRASLAALHGLPSAADAHLRLATFFKKVLGARAVLDLGVAREVALLEAAEEFCARYALSGRLAAAASTLRAAGAKKAAARAEAALAEYQQQRSGDFSSATSTTALLLPVLTSACPGWVCYAEKTHPDATLPYLSAARSPQGVMGRLVKGGSGGARGSWGGPSGEKVYHVTVMPCYDKKLEAARDELVVGGGGAGGEGAGGNGGAATSTPPEPEVDCCLATSEVQALLEAHGCADLAAVEPAQELDTLDGRTLPADAFLLAAEAAAAAADQPPLHDRAWGAPGFLPGSGGWAAFVMRYAGRRLFGLDLLQEGGGGGGGGGGGAASGSGGDGGALALPPPRRLRNADMHELALEVRHALEAEGVVAAGGGDGSQQPPPLLRFCAAYGFRNIQAVVRRLPPAPAPSPPLPPPSSSSLSLPLSSSSPPSYYYDFVEVMACPGGCLNGGGQMGAAKAVAAAGVGGAGGGGKAKAAAAATLDELEAYFAGAPGPEVAMDVDGPSAPAWEPGRSAAAQRVYRGLLLAGAGGGGEAGAAAAPGSAAARAAFHTTFRRREKTLASAVGDW
jgi:iron only hydrogenase large subunit-like protein